MGCRKNGEVMAKKSSALKDHDQFELEETEAYDQEFQERTLVLRREPLPRKVHLMASGVQQIRCISCMQVKPIAGAEELGEGWVCGDCIAEV